MPKIAIVTDSTISMSPSEAEKLGVYVAPLSIIVNGTEYRDYVELSNTDLYRYLAEKADIKTSQPNLGMLHELMEKLKAEKFDEIIIFSLSKNLSGTYQSFVLSSLQSDMKNVTVVDSGTISGPLRYVVLRAAELAAEGKSKQEILNFADRVFHDTVTFIVPHNLDQLKRSGRVSSSAAALSALLKIRIALWIDNRAISIEKFDTARTEGKLFSLIIKKMIDRNVTAETHKIFIPHCDGVEEALRFITQLEKEIPGIQTEIIELPSAVATHVGLKAFGAQTTLLGLS